MSVLSSVVPAGPLYAHPLFQQLSGGAWRPGGVELTRHALNLCAFTPGMRVADVGCGAGATLEVLCKAGLNPVGLDIYPVAGQTDCPLICAHAAHLPFATASVDGLVCECVLSLVQDTHGALAEFARVLRPGGVLLLSDLFVPDFAEGATQPAHSGGPSCADNALSKTALESALCSSGLHMGHFEDHTRLLRPLAAQLLWHGLSCAGQATHRLGYGLWIARKHP